MGTKKTMMILCCALVMVFAMSTCAFAAFGPGPCPTVPSSGIDKSYNIDNSWSQDNNKIDNSVDNSNNSTNIDKDICCIGIDYTEVNVDTTLNNSGNSGIILQGSDDNIIVAVDDICLKVGVYTLYSGNCGSFNTFVNNANNTTISNSYNKADFTFTSTTNCGSFNTATVDVKDSFNRTSSVKADFANDSVDVDFVKSFNRNNLIDYNDNDCFDYDDNDLVDIDAALWLNAGFGGFSFPK